MSDMDWNKHLLDKINAQAATIAEQAAQIEALRADAERWRVGHDRYETVRRLSAPDFQDAYVLNKRTGKPFDEIIDDLRPFIRPQSGKAAQPHDNRKCSKPKCNGNMRPGTYMAQTFSGIPDFPGDTHAVTVSPAGPGRLAECLKCDACGHSVTAGKAVTP